MKQRKILSQIGNRVRERRRFLNLTQEDLGEAANISITYLSEIERGTCMPSLKVLMRLAHRLDLNLDTLFTGDGHAGIDCPTKDELIKEANAFLRRMSDANITKVIEMLKVMIQMK